MRVKQQRSSSTIFLFYYNGIYTNMFVLFFHLLMQLLNNILSFLLNSVAFYFYELYNNSNYYRNRGGLYLRTLLDQTTQRIIQIIEILAEHQDWLTIKELSDLSNSSERTIVDDIAMIRKRWGNYLDIEISKKNGIRMVNPNIAKSEKVIIDLFNESVVLQFFEAIILYPKNKIEFYEQKLFVSRSTLLRILTKINHFLKDREMWIHYQDNVYELRGNNELYLRQFCTCFLLELHQLDLKNELEHFDITIIVQLLHSLFHQNLSAKEEEYILSDSISVVYYIQYYIVSLLRENGGFSIPSTYIADIEITTEIFSYIKKYFPNITLEQLSSIHDSIGTMYKYWDSETEERTVTKEIHAFYNRIFDFIQTTPDEQVLDRLCFTLKSLYFVAKYRPYQTSILFDRIHYFSLSLKKNNKAMYQLVKQNFEIFSQKIQFDMSPRLADLLFWICLHYPEFSIAFVSKSALVISNFGKQHTDYLTQFFNSYFNSNNKIVLKITASNFPDVDSSLKEYDFIITTIPDLAVEHDHIILVNDYPSTENLFEIHKMLFHH